MNLNRIESIAASYEASASDATRLSIALFHPLWRVQAALARQAAAALDTSGWIMPPADDLVRWYWADIPFLTQAPLPLTADMVTKAAQNIAGALTNMDEVTDRILTRCDWEQVVAHTPLDIAGADPAAYLDGSEEAAQRFLGDNYAVAILVLSLALRPLLEPASERLMAAARNNNVNEVHGLKPRHCPVCGSAPCLAHVGPTSSNNANVRTLYCNQCGCEWEFERIRCVRCGDQSQTRLHYKSIAGDDAHRLHICDSCHGYLRSHFALGNELSPYAPEVEDVVMAELDAVAASLGLSNIPS